MTLKRAVLLTASRVVPDLSRPTGDLLLTFAHIVSDSPPPHVKHLYAVPGIAKFKSDVAFLCRHCKPLQIAELEQLPLLRGAPSSARYFTLSFDDGMREAY